MSEKPAHKTPARCWYCERPLSYAEIEQGGILRSRQPRAGGPYRILPCPACGRDNSCEETRRGHWFASPNLRVSVFEYFFSHVLDTRPEDFLAAAAWFRENDERRRYFFERDGDRRYSAGWRHGGGWLGRLWRQVPGDLPPRPARRAAGSEATGEPSASAGAGRGRGESEPEGRTRREPPPRRQHPEVLPPHEILGVAAGASDREIRAAFRRLARQYHPDKVHHLGEDYQRLAHQKFVVLKEAYEEMTRSKD